jgi:hypothetical protein
MDLRGGYRRPHPGSGSAVGASAELYDPVTDTWSSAGDMAATRTNASPVRRSNGEVLVSGGFTCTSGATASAELFGDESLGGPCAGLDDGDSGSCADGVCCDTGRGRVDPRRRGAASASSGLISPNARVHMAACTRAPRRCADSASARGAKGNEITMAARKTAAKKSAKKAAKKTARKPAAKKTAKKSAAKKTAKKGAAKKTARKTTAKKAAAKRAKKTAGAVGAAS